MKCRQCGRKNAWQSEFCSGCGHALEPAPTPQRPDSAESGPESWKWVAIWALVVLVIVGILCVFAFQPEETFKHSHPLAPSAHASLHQE